MRRRRVVDLIITMLKKFILEVVRAEIFWQSQIGLKIKWEENPILMQIPLKRVSWFKIAFHFPEIGMNC